LSIYALGDFDQFSGVDVTITVFGDFDQFSGVGVCRSMFSAISTNFPAMNMMMFSVNKVVWGTGVVANYQCLESKTPIFSPIFFRRNYF
jgi:hypothetical protein